MYIYVCTHQTRINRLTGYILHVPKYTLENSIKRKMALVKNIINIHTGVDFILFNLNKIIPLLGLPSVMNADDFDVYIHFLPQNMPSLTKTIRQPKDKIINSFLVRIFFLFLNTPALSKPKTLIMIFISFIFYKFSIPIVPIPL